MRKLSLFFCLILLLSSSLFGQTNSYTLSGEVEDTVNFQFTQYTTLTLIRASDSLLKSFTRADENGHFTLQTDSPGHYILLFEHPRFATFVIDFNLTKTDTNLGVIPMVSKRSLLKEVVIVGKNAITIKGDTIEYFADSFKTGQYDDVEALLRQLPGIEVGSDGSIKAYGKKVEKMLVDGEEFFSDDPAMVAKMLRASAVKTVQVYDKKSDKAEFTGIDDGERIKTINLELKGNAKNGYFGKLAVGGGLPDYWQNEAMINAFKRKRKVSAYFIMSNTNQGGLGMKDSRNFGDGRNSGYVVMGRRNSSGGSYNSGGDFSGQGLPKTWTGGLHYNNSWWGDTLSLAGNYSFRKNDISALNNTVTHYILPDTQYYNHHTANRYQSNLKHGFSLNSNYKIDSLSSINMRLTGNVGKDNSADQQYSDAQSAAGDLVNDNNQTQESSGDNQAVNIYLSYRKRFNKKGRSISANFNGSLNNSKEDGFLNSIYHLFAIDSTKEIDQRKLNENKNKSVGLGLNYTEPLFKDAYLSFKYQFNLNDQHSFRQSFNRAPGGSYENVLDSLYSSNYSYRVLGNRGGVTFQYNSDKKFNLSIGGDISNTQYAQEDIMYDSTIIYNYLNFFPSLSFSFRKSRMSSFNFNYNGSSKQPSLSQLQPLRDNEDPLNVAIGNPDLKQAFRHDVSLFYYNFQVLSGQSIFVTGNFSFTQNAITTKQNVDFAGRRTYQYVNVKGNYNGGINANYGRKVFNHLQVTIGADVSYNHTHNFINNLANTNKTWTLGPSLRLGYNLDTTLTLYFHFIPSYNSTLSEIRPDIKTQYWNYNQGLTSTYQLPLHFKVGTSVSWDIRQQLNVNDRQNKVFIWNAWLSRSFLKDQSLELKIYANDLLNQNIGYSRVTTAEQISESNYNTIQRYLMLSLTWNFTHYRGNAEPKEEGSDFKTN